MAQNQAQDYGIDVACVVDADELFSEVEGIDLVAQDALHAITQEDFLGPGGDARGIDVRTFMGANQSVLTSRQPIVAEVLERDDRITHADVVLTEITTKGLSDVLLDITCFTEEGSFTLTRKVSELTATEMEEGDA